MKTIPIISNAKHVYEKNTIDITDFYNQATEDYSFWSKDYNMHFGYFSWRNTNIFKRDTMLNQMNDQVLKRLELPSKSLLVDLGCGMGGTMRYAMQKFKDLSTIGITLSDFQAHQGNQLLKRLKGTILKENYNKTSLSSNSAHGAIAIESFCHSGHDQSAFKEAYRILKQGGKLVIADAFLKKDPSTLCYGSATSYRKLCNHWGLEKLGEVTTVAEQLKKVGFRKVTVENISFRVAPSVLHVPFAIVGFIIRSLFKQKPLNKHSFHNLKGSFYALISGLHLKSFGYYLITCQK